MAMLAILLSAVAEKLRLRRVFSRLLSVSPEKRIFIALLLAVVAGFLTGPEQTVAIKTYDFLGQLFLRALKMLVVPLIVSALINAIGQIRAEANIGRIGIKIVLYYATTTVVAVLIGLAMVNLIKPGIADGQPIEIARDADYKPALTAKSPSDLPSLLLRMIPENVFSSATNNSDMISVIIFTMLFGFFLSRLGGEAGKVMKSFWAGAYEIMLGITRFVMFFAPIGVFGLVASVVAQSNINQLASLVPFFVTVLLALSLHLFLFLPVVLMIVARASPLRAFRALAPALLTAFSTSSSSATVPVTMECLQKNARVSDTTTSLVVPLGATVNMDGTALYECVVAMFIAQVYGIDLSFGTQFLVVALAVITSIGVAGVPSASLVAIVIILEAIGLPSSALGAILLFDRPLDMCRTVVNVFSDATGSIVIAKTEGETEVLT